MKVILGGAGIGGLAAAIALRRVGVEVAVFERAPVLTAAGAGISLWTNAIKALRAIEIDLADRVVARGRTIGRVTSRNANGEALSEIDIAEVSARHGADSVCVHRGDLQAELLAALPPGVVQTGRAIAGVTSDDGRATATFDDGSSEHADVIVGADGIRSAVRTSLFGDTPARYAGYTAWRGIAPIPPGMSGDDLLQAAMGPGSQAAIFRCSEDRLYWFVTKLGDEHGVDADGHKQGALQAIAEWRGGAPFRRVIEATPEEHVLRNDIYDLPKLERWGRGRVTLLGDAAHATTPNLGQGGCMAIEDAVALAHALRGAGAADVESRLRAYEESRLARADLVVARSRVLGYLFLLENPIALKLRDWAMTLSASKASYVKTLEELFAYEPPSLMT